MPENGYLPKLHIYVWKMKVQGQWPPLVYPPVRVPWLNMF